MQSSFSISSDSLYAAIDIGTTSIKCIALNSATPELVQIIGSMPTDLSRMDGGGVEVNPQAVLDACLLLLEKLMSHAKQHQQIVASVGLTGFVGSAVCIDREGTALPPCATWQDQRCGAQSQEFFDVSPQRLREIHGITLPQGVCWPGPKIRWLKDNRPEVLQKTWKVLQIKDYVFYHLTGLAYSEARTFIGLANIIQNRFDPQAVAWCGIRQDQLPELRRADEVFAMNDRWQQRLGVDRAHLPVIGIGTADMTAAFLGCLLEEHEGALLANTSEIISFAIVADNPAPTSDGVIRVPYRPGLDLVYGSTTNGGTCIDWFTQVFGPVDLDSLADAAAKIPPGCDGALFLPYLTGERAPLWNSHATGVFAGLRATHTKAHLYRAVLEGCSLSKRHVLQTADPRKYGGVTHLRICGGGSRAALWNQIRASVLGLPLEADQCLESSALGALWLAAGQADPQCLARFRQNRRATTVAPIALWTDVYDRIYANYVELISNTQK